MYISFEHVAELWSCLWNNGLYILFRSWQFDNNSSELYCSSHPCEFNFVFSLCINSLRPMFHFSCGWKIIEYELSLHSQSLWWVSVVLMASDEFKFLISCSCFMNWKFNSLICIFSYSNVLMWISEQQPLRLNPAEVCEVIAAVCSETSSSNVNSMTVSSRLSNNRGKPLIDVAVSVLIKLVIDMYVSTDFFTGSMLVHCLLLYASCHFLSLHKHEQYFADSHDCIWVGLIYWFHIHLTIYVQILLWISSMWWTEIHLTWHGWLLEKDLGWNIWDILYVEWSFMFYWSKSISDTLDFR